MVLRHRRGWRMLQVACALLLAAALSGLFMPETAQAGGTRDNGRVSGQYSYGFETGSRGFRGGHANKRFMKKRVVKKRFVKKRVVCQPKRSFAMRGSNRRGGY